MRTKGGGEGAVVVVVVVSIAVAVAVEVVVAVVVLWFARTISAAERQMEKAFRTSPETAAVFRAANKMASLSNTGTCCGCTTQANVL